jgi:hypothetical protein
MLKVKDFPAIRNAPSQAYRMFRRQTLVIEEARNYPGKWLMCYACIERVKNQPQALSSGV